MLSIIRNVDTKQVVYVSNGNVTHNESGVSDDLIADVTPGSWPTTEGWEMVTAELELPADYVGEIYKLVEDGDTYRWDLM